MSESTVSFNAWPACDRHAAGALRRRLIRESNSRRRSAGPAESARPGTVASPLAAGWHSKTKGERMQRIERIAGWDHARDRRASAARSRRPDRDALTARERRTRRNARWRGRTQKAAEREGRCRLATSRNERGTASGRSGVPRSFPFFKRPWCRLTSRRAVFCGLLRRRAAPLLRVLRSPAPFAGGSAQRSPPTRDQRRPERTDAADENGARLRIPGRRRGGLKSVRSAVSLAPPAEMPDSQVRSNTEPEDAHDGIRPYLPDPADAPPRVDPGANRPAAYTPAP